MRELVIVGTGSFLGGISRFYLSGWALHTFPSTRFPLGTLIVNILGCFLIGLIAGLAESHHFFTQHVRLFLITGALGGFTTFSAFGYETIFLARTNSIDLAILNIALSVAVCLIAVWLGLRFTSLP